MSLIELQPAITWIKVEKPTFDLVGVVLGSMRLAGAIVLLALAVGALLGAARIRSRRRQGGTRPATLSLQLRG